MRDSCRIGGYRFLMGILMADGGVQLSRVAV